MGGIDIHTHRCNHNDNRRIGNLMAGRDSVPEGEGAFSIGIHPWYIDSCWREQLVQLDGLLTHDRRLVAVGECGLDALASSSLELQLEVFERQCAMAEKHALPMILHVVKAHSQVLALRKRMGARMPWVIHGFRGKPALALQYLQAGCYLSFGERFNPATPPVVPASHLLLETDESDLSICQIAEKVAQSCAIAPEELLQQATFNAEHLFFQNR